MKKLIALLLVLVMALSIAACGAKTETPAAAPEAPAAAPEAPAAAPEAPAVEENPLAGTKIEIATRSVNETLDNLKTVIANFTAETGIIVELTEYGSDYEEALKTRMAANELPDVWETHGWSRLRYGEYLLPVNDQPWYNKMNDLARGILEGEGGVGYGLMMNAAAIGIVVNNSKCQELGIDPYSWKTIADFEADCQKALDQGVVPLLSDRAAGDLAHMAGMFTTYDDAPFVDAEAQLNGTWDYESNMTFLRWMAGLLDKGFFHVDTPTIDYNTMIERLASGDALFRIGYNCHGAVHDLNEDADIIIVPFPAVKEGSKAFVAGGEEYCIGAWKDSPNLEGALAYLAYMAEHGDEVVGGLVCVEGFEANISADWGCMKTIEMMERFPDVRYSNMWDREYMPSGMWGILGKATEMLYADWSEEGLEAVNQYLKEGYDEKYAAAHG